MIGKTIYQYEILRELGRGGMGEVYEAKDMRLGRNVAIKVLPDRALQDPSAIERFQREARTASALNHPNIVTIHDIVELDGQQFIIMELIQGRTLRRILSEGIALPDLVGVIQQVAQALTVAHEAGIIHRDLKPENIMVRDDGYAKILDFGLARLAIPLGSGERTLAQTAPGAVVGTIPYMSPEQCSGSAVQSSSDIFSLGVVLYEMATGHHPFRAESGFACMHRITSEAPVSPSKLSPGVSADLETVLLKMLEKDPRLRPGAADVAHRLSRAGRGRSTQEQGSTQSENVGAMVGRDEQEEALFEMFESARKGHGRLACVTGEPGMGKTTLVEGFLRKLSSGDEPCLIARGRCSERLAGTEAYLPLMEALDSLLRDNSSGQVVETMKLLAPTWYFRIAPVTSEDSASSKLLDDARAASQERMKRELFSFLEELSREAPVVFFFDDLHWADASTIDFLAYMGVHSEGLRFLTVATYRPSDMLLADHPFIGVKRELQARGICQEVPLGFLSRDDISRYLDLEFSGHAFEDSLVDLVHTRTEGNPLFLVNVLRYLEASGALEKKDRWRLVKPLEEIEKDVPESVRSMIDRKIEQLSDEDRRLLITASVQGAEFHASVVAEAAGEDEVEVEERLEKLDRVHAFVRLVQEEELPDGSLTLRYVFVHALYQNGLYDTLTPARRAAQSAAVANALSSRYEEDESAIAGELGMLFEVARDFSHAADFFLQAAERATRLHANHEAVELCRRAIASAKKLKGKDRPARIYAASMQLAQLQMTLSLFAESEKNFQVAEQAAEAAGLADERIRAICCRAMSFFNLKRLDETRAGGERALELARSAGLEVGVASAELVIASERLCVGDLSAAEPMFQRAIPTLRKAGLQMQALEGVIYSAGLHVWKNEYEEALRLLGMALEQARALGAGFAIVAAQFFRSLALGNQGRLGEALESLRDGRRLAELNQERYWLPRLPNTAGWIHRELGDAEKAHQLNLENVELAREFDMPEGEANAHVNLAGDYFSLGEPERAREHLEKAEALFEQDVWFRWRYSIRLKSEWARYWIERGDLDRAREFARASGEAARSHQCRKYAAWAHTLEAEIGFLEEDMDAVGKHLGVSIAILEQHPCPTIMWKVLRLRSQWAGRLGDTSLADDYRGRARRIIQNLADSVTDEALRTKFLKSRAVREI